MSWSKLARLQHSRPWWFTAIAFALALLALPLLLRLRVNADLRAVLPDSAQSVRDLDEIRDRMSHTTTIALAVQSTSNPPDYDALHAYVSALATELGTRSDLQVVSVDANIGDFRDFVEKNRFLYADRADLVALRDTLSARIAWEKADANPLFSDLSDDPPPDPQKAADTLKRHADEARAKADRFPGGFYQHPTLPMDFIFVRTTIRPGDSKPIDQLVAGI